MIFVKNDPGRRWVNETIGIVHELYDDGIEVEVGRNLFKVYKTKWEVINYKYNEEEKDSKKELMVISSNFLSDLIGQTQFINLKPRQMIKLLLI